MPCTLPTAEHPARRVADPALTGLLEDVPVVIRALVERAKLKRSGAGPRLRRPGRDAERAQVVDVARLPFCISTDHGVPAVSTRSSGVTATR